MARLNPVRLAVLSLFALAALAAPLASGTPARAESDNRPAPQQQNSREVDIYYEFNRGPCGYNPEPVHGQQACPLPPSAAPVGAPPVYAAPVPAPPVYAPPVHAPPVHVQPPYAPVLSDAEIERAWRPLIRPPNQM